MDKHFPVRNPPELIVGRYSHRSNFSGLTNYVIAQYSLFLTLMILCLPASCMALTSFFHQHCTFLPPKVLHNLSFSLCFRQTIPSGFLPYKAETKLHLKTEKPSQKSLSQKKSMLLFCSTFVFYLLHIFLTL